MNNQHPALENLLQHKKILLLQGPMGCFFWRLANWLRQHGNKVKKINFNGGDWLFYPFHAANYRGNHADWEQYIAEYLIQNSIDAVVLFGQERPVHSIAQVVATKKKIPVFIFEEGYVRPDYITLEMNGVNACSSLPRDSNFYRQVKLNDNKMEYLETKQKFCKTALLALGYGFCYNLLYIFFPYHHYHRSMNPVKETWYWSRGGVKKIYRYFKDKAVLQQIVQTSQNKNWFLVPLQTHADSQISRHSSYINIEEFIKKTMLSFANNSKDSDCLLIKHHPMDRAYKDYSALIEQLSTSLKVKKRVFYVFDLPLPALLRHCKAVVTINSTVGVQALSYNLPVKVMGEALYNIAEITNQQSLDEFWCNYEPVNQQLFAKFKKYLIQQTQLNGSFYAETPILKVNGK